MWQNGLWVDDLWVQGLFVGEGGEEPPPPAGDSMWVEGLWPEGLWVPGLWATGTTDPGGDELVAGTITLVSVTYRRVRATGTPASGGVPPYSYQWERSTTSGSGFTALTGQTALDLDDLTVDPEETYYYRRKDTDSDGGVEYTNEIQADTPAAPPPAPLPVGGRRRRAWM